MPTIDVKIPDIGDFKNIPVIEVHVKPGDTLSPEDPIVTLESDKATMEVPSPASGKVIEVLLKAGDRVSEGSLAIRLEGGAGAATSSNGAAASAATSSAPATGTMAAAAPTSAAAPAPHAAAMPPVPPMPSARPLPPPLPVDFGNVHASPSVRRLARELDIDLTQVTGTGEKGRITAPDVKGFVQRSGGGGATGGVGIPEIPAQDFAKFGPIETKPLSRLKKLSGPHLHRSWLNVPHVTHTDEADITDLEGYRKLLDGAAKDKGYRVTLLSFLMKASVSALKAYPDFNSSLSPDKSSLIHKKYYHLGVAVDTPDGLVVPVIKDVDRKGIVEISQELAAVSARMRDGKIAPTDIQGGTFSISSLGGIGGTQFTPIVNAPEVAILGVVKSTMKPVWNGTEFKPRLMLPLCVSYDHRVIDGASAARFTKHLSDVMSDVRQLVL
ncbi:MAG: 2-oxo acid dehydrogenase subunit E2 [Hyphomicrobiaceae bacterium]|nr:2-oxo acid dehydrogenase subunit E2 [Hyphomicrobiaceae bacterium]